MHPFRDVSFGAYKIEQVESNPKPVGSLLEHADAESWIPITVRNALFLDYRQSLSGHATVHDRDHASAGRLTRVSVKPDVIYRMSHVRACNMVRTSYDLCIGSAQEDLMTSTCRVAGAFFL